MPQSLTKLYAHLIFSTKNRQPFLAEEIRPPVHAYVATVIRNMDAPYVVVGGVADHVHILFDTERRRSRKSFGSFWNATALSMTSGTFGIDTIE